MKNVRSQKGRSVVFCIAYSAVITALLFVGLSGNIHADTVNNHQQSQQQYKQQNRPALVQKVNHAKPVKNNKVNWFRDGLSNRNYKARGWVSWHESNNHWNVLSYGGRCIGRFQLDHRYLGKKNGHVNLNHKHQVKVADKYAKTRYGNWVNAKKFWQAHHWY